MNRTLKEATVTRPLTGALRLLFIATLSSSQTWLKTGGKITAEADGLDSIFDEGAESSQGLEIVFFLEGWGPALLIRLGPI